MYKNNKYYELKPIATFNANYKITLSKSLNKEKYIDVYKHLIKKCILKHEQFFILLDSNKRFHKMLDILNELKEYIKILLNNEEKELFLYDYRIYTGVYDKIKRLNILDKDPIAYFMSLKDDSFKPYDFSKVNNIILHNFINFETDNKEECIKFLNLISTIIRDRTNVEIYMFGNIEKYK